MVRCALVGDDLTTKFQKERYHVIPTYANVDGQQESHFFKLAFELREEVYQLVVSGSPVEDEAYDRVCSGKFLAAVPAFAAIHPFGNHRSTLPTKHNVKHVAPANLVSTCKAVYNELIEFAVKRTEWDFATRLRPTSPSFDFELLGRNMGKYLQYAIFKLDDFWHQRLHIHWPSTLSLKQVTLTKHLDVEERRLSNRFISIWKTLRPLECVERLMLVRNLRSAKYIPIREYGDLNSRGRADPGVLLYDQVKNNRRARIRNRPPASHPKEKIYPDIFDYLFHYADRKCCRLVVMRESFALGVTEDEELKKVEGDVYDATWCMICSHEQGMHTYCVKAIDW